MLRTCPILLAALPCIVFCLFKRTPVAIRSPGGAALFADTVVLGSCVAVTHHTARSPLFPPVHHALCLGARVTLKHAETRPEFRETW